MHYAPNRWFRVLACACLVWLIQAAPPQYETSHTCWHPSPRPSPHPMGRGWSVEPLIRPSPHLMGRGWSVDRERGGHRFCNAPYEYSDAPDPDGIGKFYFGREIARVMGHQGAPWLERPEREEEEKPALLLELMGLQPGDVVADIGAGSGYHTRRLARAVSPRGTVFAVELQPEMLNILTNRLAAEGVSNVVPVLSSITDPRLPEARIDVALLVDVYHEFSHPYEMMEGICRALKPSGRVVLVEYRAEDPEVPIKDLHRMSEAQVRREMAVHPLVWERTVSDQLPWQHYIEFRKQP